VHIDLSQLEALTGLLAPELVEQQLTGVAPERRGNSGRTAAHQGCYPARDPGTWIVLAVGDDATWTALAGVAATEWAVDPRFADAAGRRRHGGELDAALADWTRRHDNVELADALQAVGVAAAPVVRPAEVLADDHLASRGSYVELDRAHVGRHRYPVLPFKFSATPGRIRRAAPTLGQDNDAVLGGRLGLSPDRLADLRAARVIGEDIDG
jgi:crotonobetainyl-CoA:carnitine CoA-transferase CaiB-like acyl-CoA transferase